MSLDDLNERANKSFDRIKNEKGWTADKVRQLGRIKIDKEKLQQMLEQQPDINIDIDKGEGILSFNEDGKETIKADLVTDITKVIDSFELSPKLSIAIAYIVTSKNKEKISNLEKAIELIREEINN